MGGLGGLSGDDPQPPYSWQPTSWLVWHVVLRRVSRFGIASNLVDRQFTVPIWAGLSEGEQLDVEEEDVQTRGAARGSPMRREAFLHNSVWRVLTDSGSVVQVPTWPVGVRSLRSLPRKLGVSERRAAVSSLAPSPLTSANAIVLSHLPMWPSPRRPWPSSSCVQGRWGTRSHALECAAVQVCREAGSHVSTNVMVRDLAVTEFKVRDARRLEIVADGLDVPLWRRSARDRQDFAVSLGQGWHSQERCSNRRRGVVDDGSSETSAHQP